MPPNIGRAFDEARDRAKAAEARLCQAQDKRNAFQHADDAARSHLRHMTTPHSERERDRAARNFQYAASGLASAEEKVRAAAQDFQAAQSEVQALWPQFWTWVGDGKPEEETKRREQKLQDEANHLFERELRERELQQEADRMRQRQYEDRHRQDRERWERNQQRQESEMREKARARRAQQEREWQEYLESLRQKEQQQESERLRQEQQQREKERPRRQRYALPLDPTKPARKPAARTTSAQIENWHAACVTAFADKTRLRAFPQPPSEPCNNAACALTATTRALMACPCNVRKLFHGRATKQERLAFHPDRFSSVPDEAKGVIQQAAREVFVVVDGLYQGRQ
ncbi:hypothetical protein LTR53_011549 [Teratosphaeriaceae sp. CCFEE 6253]|nr:hypothetical protein LTR53_011549 [Teratosphaeriaceae sp. CCFEE 6253]